MPHFFQLLESNDWEELQTVELPDASLENLQLLLDVVYNGEVEATIEDLREMILLAHRLYISIPLSDDLMAGLDLTLPELPPFTPPVNVDRLLSTLTTAKPAMPPLPALSAAGQPQLKTRLPGPSPLVNGGGIKRPSPVAASSAAAATAAAGGGFRRKLEPSVITAIMASSKNAEHVCPLCNIKFNNGTAFKQHMKTHDDNEELREQRNAVLGEMIATCFSE